MLPNFVTSPKLKYHSMRSFICLILLVFGAAFSASAQTQGQPIDLSKHGSVTFRPSSNGSVRELQGDQGSVKVSTKSTTEKTVALFTKTLSLSASQQASLRTLISQYPKLFANNDAQPAKIAQEDVDNFLAGVKAMLNQQQVEVFEKSLVRR